MMPPSSFQDSINHIAGTRDRYLGYGFQNPSYGPNPTPPAGPQTQPPPPADQTDPPSVPGDPAVPPPTTPTTPTTPPPSNPWGAGNLPPIFTQAAWSGGPASFFPALFGSIFPNWSQAGAGASPADPSAASPTLPPVDGRRARHALRHQQMGKYGLPPSGLGGG